MFARKFALIAVAGTLLGAGAVQADPVFPESAIEYPQFEYSKKTDGTPPAERDAGTVAGERDSVFPESAIEYPQFGYSQKPAHQGAATVAANRVNGHMIGMKTTDGGAGGTFPASAIE